MVSKGSSKLNVSRPIFMLSVAFVALVAFVIINLVVVFIDAARDRQNLDHASELRALSYRLTGLSRDATNGDEAAFSELRSVVGQMDSSWDQLRDSGGELPTDSLTAFESSFAGIQTQAGEIIEGQETIIFLHDVVSTLNDRLPQLQDQHTQVVDTLLDGRAPADQVAVAQAQSWRAERVGRNVDKMLAGGADAEAAADQFNRDANLFGRVLEGMKNGDIALGISRVTDSRARESLEQISTQFEFVSNSVQEIFDATPALFRARQASDRILDQSPALLESINGLSEAISALPANRTLSN
ncbi:MAG TPA: chemotaxis protein, partial [Pseudomonadaceae bacterium]|nr:chemotaxis protein [Pseudomonadaceae bacterium]